MSSFRNFIKRNNVILSVGIIIIIGFIYYFYIHRHPRTDNAFVVANVRPVSALVPGHITKIYVVNNQKVKKGQKLFTVYQKPYELRVERLRGDLAAAEYKVDSIKLLIDKGQFQLKLKKSDYDNSLYLAKQAQLLAKDRAVSQKHSEILTRKMQVNKDAVMMAEKEVDVLKQELKERTENVKSLSAQLQNAKIELELTTVYTQSDGLISNMFIAEGIYAEPGEPLFSFVDTDRWWVQANLKETELANVRAGQTVEIRLWLYPGHVFHGKVANMGWNVERQLTSDKSALAVVKKENEWFLLPQRFPVQILLTDHDIDKYSLHVGASATIKIQTEASEFEQIFHQFGLW
jgi:multidrug resistance efflux pump